MPRSSLAIISRFAGTLIVLFGLTGQVSAKEPYCRWDGVTPERVAASDAELYGLDDPRALDAIAEHLPFGLPEGIDETDHSEMLLAQPYFLIWYDTDLRIPLWTAHRLTRSEAEVSSDGSGAADWEARKDSFRSDPRLTPEQASTCRDYKEPIFDQGHMVPNADLDFIPAGEDHSVPMDHTFLMSNMSPQHCAFNRGPWMVLEGLARSWAEEYETVWIISGTVFDRDQDGSRDPDEDAWRMAGRDGQRRVAIPSAQYKIVARLDRTGWDTLAVLVPNTDDLIPNARMGSYLDDHVVGLSELVKLTGQSFYPELAVTESTELWPTPARLQSVLTSGCDSSYPEN